MKIRYLREFLTALAFSFVLIGGLNQDTFGQGKGNKGGGGGNPRGGPPPQQQRGGPPPGRGGGQPQMRPQPQQQVRQQPQFRQMPQMRPQPQPQQQRVFSQPPGQMRQEQRVFRQPQMRPQPQQQVFRQSPGQMRRQEQRVFQQPQMRQQQQERVYGQAPGQMRREERRALRQPQQIFRQQMQQASRGQMRKMERQQQLGVDQSPVFRGQERVRGNVRGDQQVGAAPVFGSGWAPPGQIRSAEVRERNAIRQAERQSQPVYQQPYYSGYAPVYDYGYATPNYSEVYYPSYQYYVTQYVYPYDYSGYGGYLASSPLYMPNSYIYAPYSAYAMSPYYDYYSAPYYSSYDYGFDWKSMLVRTLIGFALGSSDNDYYGVTPYDPYNGYGYTQALYSGDSYAPYGGYYPTYQEIDYVQPVYSYADYDVPLVDVIPMSDMFGPGYGGYSSVTYREVLAQGYEQGYQAGWYARENKLQNDWFSSGYTLEDDYVDPYAYSIGENRRCFSEGYALGYQDALGGRQDYYTRYAGDTDLVSLLLSNVIGVV